MAAFTLLHASGIHLCCWTRTIVHFLCCIVFHYMTIPQFTYPFCSRWTLRLFSTWGYYKECRSEHSHVDLLVTHAHTSVVCGIGVELLGHEVYVDGTLFVFSGSIHCKQNMVHGAESLCGRWTDLSAGRQIVACGV